MLNRTNGFRALMKVFPKAYNYFASPGQFVSSSQYMKLFSKVDVDDNYFNIDIFKPGTSGESALRRFLEDKMGLSEL